MRVSVDFEPLPVPFGPPVAGAPTSPKPAAAEVATSARAGEAEGADPDLTAAALITAAPDGDASGDVGLGEDASSDDVSEGEASATDAGLPEAVAFLFAWLEDRFGLGEAAFAQHRFWHRPGHPSVWVADAQCLPPMLPRAEAVGLLVARLKGRVIKPTSVFLQRFGHACTRNVYVLDDARLYRWLAHQPVPVTPVDDGDGFVLVRDAAGTPIGCGMLRGAVLTSELPRSWTYAD